MIDPELSEEPLIATTRMLRQFAVSVAIVLGTLALWQALVKQRPNVGLVAAVLGLTFGATGLAWPERIRPVFTGLATLTRPIGVIVSFALLAGLFYLVFTPLGFLFRVVGRDALRTRRSGEASHWSPKAAPRDMRSYSRQS